MKSNKSRTFEKFEGTQKIRIHVILEERDIREISRGTAEFCKYMKSRKNWAYEKFGGTWKF